MLHTLNNGTLQITVSEMGAELQDLVLLSKQQAYLWSGDPAFWGKKSPVLFPIVGGLHNNQYQYQGKTYALGRHGFAREKKFLLEKATETELSFLLQADEQTLAQYPFAFDFRVTYHLHGAVLRCTYTVTNTHHSDLYFSVGAHPAFRVPLEEGESYNDYQLVFDREEEVPIWPLSEQGLILPEPQPFAWQKRTTGSVIPLTKELFYGDALVFKQLQSNTITLTHQQEKKGLHFRFSGYPFFGIWSAKNAPFVCLEPWCGIADSSQTNGDLTQKEGIMALAAGESFSRHWEVEPF